ncbi:MAG TPA: hypothetical protein VLH13_03225 [Methanomassiliicoccales archaeon]|nr:hypothetical protein [Methanomassiliicoccales archaeon]
MRCLVEFEPTMAEAPRVELKVEKEKRSHERRRRDKRRDRPQRAMNPRRR